VREYTEGGRLVLVSWQVVTKSVTKTSCPCGMIDSYSQFHLPRCTEPVEWYDGWPSGTLENCCETSMATVFP
jgi:hypothetical protein